MRKPLKPLTLLTLLLTFLSLRQSGWFEAKGTKPVVRTAQAGDLDGAAAWRHRHVLPSHWKQFMLRRN
jgi:hypothetical protein